MDVVEPGWVADPARTLPPWSPDGTRFAYVTGDDSQTTRVVRVKNIETGDDRELYRADNITRVCCRSPPECAVLRQGDERRRRPADLFGVARFWTCRDSRNSAPGWVIEQMTADDRKIVSIDRGTNGRFEWEIATGEQRAVSFYRSEDARWSLSRGADSIQIRPATDGTDWRPLLARSTASGGLDVVRFSPDGNWVLYHDRDSPAKMDCTGLRLMAASRSVSGITRPRQILNSTRCRSVLMAAASSCTLRESGGGGRVTTGCWRTSFRQRPGSRLR